jgi:hypothetical protein
MISVSRIRAGERLCGNEILELYEKIKEEGSEKILHRNASQYIKLIVKSLTLSFEKNQSAN